MILQHHSCQQGLIIGLWIDTLHYDRLMTDFAHGKQDMFLVLLIKT